jgi:hypothetical protein
VSRVSEGRISALAHAVIDAITKVPGATLKDGHLMLVEVKAALTDHLQIDDAVDARVRRKIESLARRVPEGSAEWNVLYRQYTEEEKRKLGR